MKKILAILLAVVMTVSMITPVFAASYSDTAENDYEAAIEHLSGLGVIDGMGDGTFAPAAIVTRAQMAKLLVVSLGLEQGAAILNGETQFNDVPASHWATGFINIAVAQGLIKGDGDGNFRPDDTVNYAEACTMCLRALGYGELIEKKGQWPANYLAKANTLELFEDVKLDGTTVGASRGSIAQIMWNMLNTEMWDITTINETNGASSTGTQKSMYQTFFTDFCTNGVENIAKGALSAMKVIDGDTIEATIGGKAIRYDGISPLNFIGTAKYEAIWKDEKIDGETVKVGVSLYEDLTDVLVGRITKVVAGDATKAAKVTVNGTEYTFAAVGAQAKAVEGAFIICKLDNNGKITVATAEYWGADALIDVVGTTKSLLVKEVKSSTDGKTTKLNGYTAVTLDIDNEKKDVMYVTFEDGASEIVTKDAIKANTVIEQVGNTTGLLYVVTDKTVTGKISSITDNKYVIDGEKYAISEDDAQVKFASKSTVKTVDALTQAGLVALDAEERALVGKTVTAKLTSDNTIAYIDSEDVAVADNYGVLLFTNDKVVDGKQVSQATIASFDGTITTYDVINKADGKTAITAQLDADGYTAANVGKIVKFELKNGKVALDATTDVVATVDIEAATTVDTTLNKATIDQDGVDAKTYRIASDSKIVKYDTRTANLGVEKCDMVNISLQDLVAATPVDADVLVIPDANDATVAKYIVIAVAGPVATGDKLAIVAGAHEVENDKEFATLYIPGEGEKRVQVNLTDGGNLYKEGLVVKYTISKDSDNNDEYNINTATAISKITVAKNANDEIIITNGNYNEILVAGGATGLVYETVAGENEVLVVDLDGNTTVGSINDIENGFEVYGVEKTNTGANYYSTIIVIEK